MTSQMTDREAAVYDRQIRLWGAKAQARLRSSKVLVCGKFGGVAVELTKNLVLAGVSCTIQDSGLAEERDFACNFFLKQDSAGKNRAEACIDAIRELNPLVKVECEPRTLTEVLSSDEFMKQFSVVCYTGTCVQDACKVDELCRERGIFFFASASSAFIGYMFSDLGDAHEYVETTKKGEETSTKKDTAASCSFDQALRADWKTLTMKKRNRVPDTYFALAMMRRGDVVSSSHGDICLEQGVDTSFCDEASVAETIATLRAGADISPVCSILGGIAGQEVIKAISGKDKPICNFFFYDAMTTGAGQERRIGLPAEEKKSAPQHQTASNKRKAAEIEIEICLDDDDDNKGSSASSKQKITSAQNSSNNDNNVEIIVLD